MKLNRLLLQSLKQWAQQPYRLPLLLRGARQTGKTWLLQELGRECFEHTAYFDFASRPALQEIFASTRDPHTILKGLNLLSEVPILPGKTLIVFDEIQLCDHAFGSLKYFAQSAPEYAVASSGSLLGTEVRRKQIFVPVGQVDIRDVWPLSFSEFLLNAAPKLYDYVEQIAELAQLPDFVLSEIEKEFVRYQCIGGMPAAVAAFMDGVDMGQIESSLRNILAMYRLDFSQYANPMETMRIAAVWDAIPSQLAKPNSRFFLSQIHANARSREFAPALQWLCEAGLVLKTCRVSTAKIPLRAYLEPEIFKLYAKDVGLLRVMANLSSDSLLNPSVMSEFKGALAENLVAISLCRTYGIEPCYWASGEKAEVDFLIESAGQVFPLEVKAGKSVAGKSLSVYARKFDPSLTIRLSGLNLKKDDRLLNVPLALVDWLPKFIEMAL
jgi:predicted AAA+ superfamily ATPase